MTSPLDSYTASMDGLHFSDEAKARMPRACVPPLPQRAPRRTFSPKPPRRS